MSIEKVYKCDLCGEFRQREQLVRLGVRLLDERPEDAENVDACLACRDRPVSDVAGAAAVMRKAVTGE